MNNSMHPDGVPVRYATKITCRIKTSGIRGKKLKLIYKKRMPGGDSVRDATS
jgi:hypothetical protein